MEIRKGVGNTEIVIGLLDDIGTNYDIRQEIFNKRLY